MLTRFLVVLYLLLIATPACATEVLVITENNPPFNYVEDGKAHGIATEIFLRMAARTGLDIKQDDIRVWPWARGYNEIQKNPNVILFSMARTKEREDLFQWIGPFMPVNLTMITRKDSKLKIEDVVRDTKGLRIGSERDSATEQILLSLGVNPKCLERVYDTKLNIHKLAEDRVDVILTLEPTLLATLLDMDLSPEQFEVAHTLCTTEFYFAASKDMDPKLVAALQHALDDLRREGFVDTLIEDRLH